MEVKPCLTSSLIEKDRRCIWHPFTQMQTAPPPAAIVRAKGSYLFAEDGRRYLDAISSWWVNLHGHTHPYIADKIKSQLDVLEHVIFAGFTHSPAVDLASRLLSLLPGKMSKVFYSDNGSTAVEVAVKIALQFWHNQKRPKQKVICFKNSYHGDTFGAMSAAGRNEFNRPFWSHLFEAEAIDPPIKDQEGLSLAQLQSVLQRQEAACFIFEPLVLGSGGMVIYPPAGLNALIRCCRDFNVLSIADEAMTGFGRTGPLFACGRLSEQPDIICLSKGLTGGFLPLGATACTIDVFNAFLSERLESAFLHGHSYTANPLACASALASLDLLMSGDCEAKRGKIAALHEEFCSKWQGHPKLVRCACLGSLLVVEYKAAKSSYFEPLRDILYRFFLKEEVLVRPLGNVLYILPPYCIEEDELKRIYSLITHTLESTL